MAHDFAAALGSIQTQSSTINNNLELILSSLSPTMSVSNINHVDTLLSVSGTAPSENEVLSYFRNLDASGDFFFSVTRFVCLAVKPG